MADGEFKSKPKGVAYYAKCFWNEKKVTQRLQELLDAKDGTIAILKNKLDTLTKEVHHE